MKSAAGWRRQTRNDSCVKSAVLASIPFLVKSCLGEGGMGVSFACSSGSEYVGVQAIKIAAIRIGSLKIVVFVGFCAKPSHMWAH